MKIVWSLFAISDREAIFNYIEVDSPRAAARIDDQIQAQVGQLTTFPESAGRAVLWESVSLFFSKCRTSSPTKSRVTPSRCCACCMELNDGDTSFKRYDPSRSVFLFPAVAFKAA